MKSQENFLNSFKAAIQNDKSIKNILYNLYLINQTVIYEYNNSILSENIIQQILEFGDYFCEHYEQITRHERLQKYNNSEPLVFKLYMFYKSEKIKKEHITYDIILNTMKFNERKEIDSLIKNINNKKSYITFEYESNAYAIDLYKNNKINKKALYYLVLLLRTNGSFVLTTENNNYELIYGIYFLNKQWFSIPKELLQKIHNKDIDKTLCYSEFKKL